MTYDVRILRFSRMRTWICDGKRFSGAGHPDSIARPRCAFRPENKHARHAYPYAAFIVRRAPAVRSGLHTATAIKAAFAPYSNAIAISGKCSDLACLTSDAGAADAYFVVSEILHWEDRATEWSGIPDRIEIKLVVRPDLQTRGRNSCSPAAAAPGARSRARCSRSGTSRSSSSS